MNTAMTFAPGLILDFTRRSGLYLNEPEMAIPMVLPCVVSLLSVKLAPKVGRWVAISMIIGALAYLAYPIFLGGDLGNHIGRVLVGGSFVYTIMRLFRMARRS